MNVCKMPCVEILEEEPLQFIESPLLDPRVLPVVRGMVARKPFA